MSRVGNKGVGPKTRSHHAPRRTGMSINIALQNVKAKAQRVLS